MEHAPFTPDRKAAMLTEPPCRNAWRIAMKTTVSVSVIVLALALASATAEPAHHKRATKAANAAQPQIACTVVGCIPVPRGCHPEMGYTPGGTQPVLMWPYVRITRFTETTAKRNMVASYATSPTSRLSIHRSGRAIKPRPARACRALASSLPPRAPGRCARSPPRSCAAQIRGNPAANSPAHRDRRAADRHRGPRQAHRR